MSSLPEQKPKISDEKENNTNKFVPMKKNKNNKRSKSKIQDDLDRLRKSRYFRELGDALDYFSD